MTNLPVGLIWSLVIQRCMGAQQIIGSDGLSDGRLSQAKIDKAMQSKVVLQRAEDPLGKGVLIGVARLGHTDGNTCFLKSGYVGP